MTNFIQQRKDQPQDVKSIRNTLLQFIKEQLRKAEGGEGGNIRALHLFADPIAEEKHLYQSAVYFDDPQRFRNEVQKIADDFAIDLPDEWTMHADFENPGPAESIKVPGLPVALFISTAKKPIKKNVADAFITVLNGEAEQDQYTLKAANIKVFIGRDKKVRTSDGFYRENAIAFKADSTHESNKYISRQHAHIEWNSETGNFFLYADEGGLPPTNKIKVRLQDGSVIKLQSTHIGHRLQEGEQIILGESALLKFSYSAG